MAFVALPDRRIGGAFSLSSSSSSSSSSSLSSSSSSSTLLFFFFFSVFFLVFLAFLALPLAGAGFAFRLRGTTRAGSPVGSMMATSRQQMSTLFTVTAMTKTMQMHIR